MVLTDEPITSVSARLFAELCETVRADIQESLDLAAAIPGDDRRAENVYRDEVTVAGQFAFCSEQVPRWFEEPFNLAGLELVRAIGGLRQKLRQVAVADKHVGLPSDVVFRAPPFAAASLNLEGATFSVFSAVWKLRKTSPTCHGASET